MVHRGLITALGFGDDGLPDGAEDALPRIAEEISAAERRAMQAERETIDRLIAGWLADRVGAVFRGRISGVTKAGLFIRLDETGGRRPSFPFRRWAPTISPSTKPGTL